MLPENCLRNTEPGRDTKADSLQTDKAYRLCANRLFIDSPCSIQKNKFDFTHYKSLLSVQPAASALQAAWKIYYNDIHKLSLTIYRHILLKTYRGIR